MKQILGDDKHLTVRLMNGFARQRWETRRNECLGAGSDLIEKIDRRVQRTHKLLQEALAGLTLERGYDTVTIRDITERADVGYATFFRHYPDKESLLADMLQAMKEDLMQLLEPMAIVTDPEHVSTVVFAYVQENATLCRVLLHSTDMTALLRPLEQISLEEAVPLLDPSKNPRLPVEIAANHLMSGVVMLIRWWLDHDLPYPPERMGQITADLVIRPVLDAFH